MKFCPVVLEICRGQVHASRKERIRNGTKTISLQTLFGRLNNNKKRSKNNKSPNVLLLLFLFFLSAKHELVHGRSQELQDNQT